MVLFLCLSNSFSYETIETQLIPLGISGIEDLLQDNVFETIDVRNYILYTNYHSIYESVV